MYELIIVLYCACQKQTLIAIIFMNRFKNRKLKQSNIEKFGNECVVIVTNCCNKFTNMRKMKRFVPVCCLAVHNVIAMSQVCMQNNW